MKNKRSSFPKEINVQNPDLWKSYRSNSQFHYHEHHIRLNPLKTIENRNLFPINHIKDSLQKEDYLSEKNNKNLKTAYDNADIQTKINIHIKNQKYQTLLEKDKHIEKLCNNKNKEIKSELDNRKYKLKQQLIRIINNAILFSKKNSPMKSMLPDNINEIVEKAKKEAQDMSFSLNISNLSRISTMREDKKSKSIELLSLIGVDTDNMTLNNVNVNINKAWNFILKLAKGRKVEDILRMKVVNAIMSITEKKASEKVRKIYEKLEMYNNYIKRKKLEEKRKKEKEEKQKYNELLKNNPNELIKLKMIKSLSQPKLFNKDDNIKNKKDNNKNNIKICTSKKKLKKSASEFFPLKQKKITRLNSYNDINQIIDFIENSKKGSQSKLCKRHFMNIKTTKTMDLNLENMLKKNEIKYKY